MGVKPPSNKAITLTARPKDAVIPCGKSAAFNKRVIEKYADELRKVAPNIGKRIHGLTKKTFLDSGLFDSAVERLRGQKSATMRDKKAFVEAVLEDLKNRKLIKDWRSTGAQRRNDYEITLKDKRIAVIETKGCLDGNNTNISERPDNADEFIVWGLCQNKGSDMQKGAWSAVHTRIGPDIIVKKKKVDGLVIWDRLCATSQRPCPKLRVKQRLTKLCVESRNGPMLLQVPPPCIYTFPETTPDFDDNQSPQYRKLKTTGHSFLSVLFKAYQCNADELIAVQYLLKYSEGKRKRKTILWRNKRPVAETGFQVIKQKNK